MTTETTPDTTEERRRLTRGERVGFAFLLGLSIFVALAGLGKAFASTFTLFGEQPTARDNAIAGQALRIALWAIATPFCALALLRGRRVLASSAIWLALLGWTAWWSWPAPPVDEIDSHNMPLWLSFFPLLWFFVAAGLAVGVHAAWRSEPPRARIAALVVLAVLAVGATSHLTLLRHQRAEWSTPLAEGATELAALRDDPFWRALPSATRSDEHEHPASQSVWGERIPTSKDLDLGTTGDPELFRAVVSAAEATGWRLIDAHCLPKWMDAAFTKLISGQDTSLRITLAPYVEGVHISTDMSGPPYEARPVRCWDPSAPPNGTWRSTDRDGSR